MYRTLVLSCVALSMAILSASQSRGDDVVVVLAKMIITVSGKPIENGAILCKAGKIVSVGESSSFTIPAGAIIKEASVVIPGLIDVRTCVGLSGIFNVEHDSDQLESSSPLQPELRAKDAYNPGEELVAYIRSFGVTTIHTGHAPGELISGQTIVTKTVGNSVEESLIVDGRAICATLGESSQKSGKQSPGTRAKQMAMLRALMFEAIEYRTKTTKKTKETSDKESEDKESEDKEPADDAIARNLRLETLVEVLDGKKALLITADRAQDIATALRFASEFGISIWLDSAAEANQMIPQIKEAKATVLLHPSMARSSGERESLSFQTASMLQKNGIPFAIQGGFEAYVPKVRVVLFEAAIAAAHGLTRDEAIESITLSPAKILGIADRVGSIEIGKDADLALYDGDPLEYTTHCIGVVVNGKVYDGEASD